MHGKALAIVVAYDMYMEVAEGNINIEWKVENPVDFWTFCEQLSIQMLQYSPTARKYPGDEKMRSETQQNALQFQKTTAVCCQGRPQSMEPTPSKKSQFLEHFDHVKRSRSGNS